MSVAVYIYIYIYIYIYRYIYIYKYIYNIYIYIYIYLYNIIYIYIYKEMIDDGEEDITKGNDEWWWQKMYKDLKILTKNHYHLVLFWLSLPQFYSKTQTKITKKMETKVEFRLLVLNSLRSEPPIDRSAKTIISKNFTISWHNQLFLWH